MHLTMLYQLAGFIQHYNDRFGAIRWTNASRARQLLNQGMEIINSNPTVDKLHPIVRGLFDCMPDDEKADAGGLLKG